MHNIILYPVLCKSWRAVKVQRTVKQFMKELRLGQFD